jgi:hypothetical protein
MAYVYLISEVDRTNNYKIGVTKKNILNRQKELQTGNSNELYINQYFETPYPFKVEKMLHRHFANKKIFNEWFELNEDDVKNFIPICKHYENICNSLKENPFF